jgi:hypothetical protein
VNRALLAFVMTGVLGLTMAGPALAKPVRTRADPR